MKRAAAINRTERMVGFRATKDDLQRLDALAEKTGLGRSDVFRALIQSAEAQPVVKWVPVVGGAQ